jgi:hypothetical protein
MPSVHLLLFYFVFISKASGSLLKDEKKAPVAEMRVRDFPPLRRKKAARMGHGAELAVPYSLISAL